MPKHDNKDLFETQKKKAIIAACELCYPHRIIEGIKHSKTETELYNWLKQGRLELS